jgi:hypothetical protein
MKLNIKKAMKFLTDFNSWYGNINWLDFVAIKYYFFKLKKKILQLG